MKYRGIDVTVKTYREHVKASAVSYEADIISKFDHKGENFSLNYNMLHKSYSYKCNRTFYTYCTFQKW